MKFILFSTFLFFSTFLAAQNIGIGTNSPNASASLDVSANNRGLLMPRLTTVQRKAITTPAFGLLVFDTDKATVMFFDGTNWKALAFLNEDVSTSSDRNSSDLQQNANFGSKVAIAGNYALIGAPRYSAGGLTNMGAAYIFSKTSSGWQQQARLVATDSAANDYFGGVVSISGDYAVVGAPNKKIGSNAAQGKVYVYKRNGINWIRDTFFTKTTGVANDNFGWSAAVHPEATGGPALAIGIPFSDVAASDKGEVYFYKRNNTTGKWAFQQSAVPSDLTGSDNFGTCISMDSNYVAIGAPYQNLTSSSLVNSGATYVYLYNGAAWTLQQKISGFYTLGLMGTSLSIFSDRLAIGAPGTSAYNNTSAAVYVYKRSGTNWSNVAGIFLYDYEGGKADISFGRSVSLYGKDLLIGASGGIDLPSGSVIISPGIAGRVYVYKNYSADVFTKKQIIQPDLSFNGDLFGQSINVSNGNYIISNARAVVNGFTNAGTALFGFIAN